MSECERESALGRSVVDAIFEEADRTDPRNPVWQMSERWKEALAAYSGTSGTPIHEARLIGIPVEVREDAGFPRLVEMSEIKCDHLWKLGTEILGPGEWVIRCYGCDRRFRTLEDYQELFGARL